jgi:hypothetical protein
MESTRKPLVPWAINSGIDPREKAITGVPHNMDSTTLSPKGSAKLMG